MNINMNISNYKKALETSREYVQCKKRDACEITNEEIVLSLHQLHNIIELLIEEVYYQSKK